MKTPSYKKDVRNFGYTDMGSFILRSPLNIMGLNVGCDGSFRVYVIDESIKVPSHYKLHSIHKNWLKVYDDRCMTLDIDAKEIRVYRAASMGILIQTIEDE